MSVQSKAPGVLAARAGADENANPEDSTGAFAPNNSHVPAVRQCANTLVVEHINSSADHPPTAARRGAFGAQQTLSRVARRRQHSERQVAS
jgi:hypothetical protein